LQMFTKITTPLFPNTEIDKDLVEEVVDAKSPWPLS